MLLDGSYLREMERITDTVRLVRRIMIQDGILKVHAYPTTTLCTCILLWCIDALNAGSR